MSPENQQRLSYKIVSMYISDIYQNDRDEKLNQKKFTLTITRQERNFHCNNTKSLYFYPEKKLFYVSAYLGITQKKQKKTNMSIFDDF